MVKLELVLEVEYDFHKDTESPIDDLKEDLKNTFNKTDKFEFKHLTSITAPTKKYPEHLLNIFFK